MNPEDLSPVVLYYSTALFFAGLACLIHHVFLDRKDSSLAAHKDLGPWKITSSDLGLILVFIYLFIFAAGILATEVYKYLYKVDGIPDDLLFLLGYPMHIAIVVSLYVFFKYFDLNEDRPISPRRAGLFNMLTQSVYFFLAVIPVLVLGSYIWPMILELLNLPVEQQDLVIRIENMEVSPMFFLIMFLAIILAPISEEFLFRVFLYRSLKRYTSPTLAAIITSLMFAGMHFNWLSFLPLFLLGVWLCRTYEKTGNIFVPIMLHTLFNANTLLVLMLINE
tara:strand:+ start:6692 stop:7528 length:837 start_codon:yes stop_codon:yes gene_type:complete